MTVIKIIWVICAMVLLTTWLGAAEAGLVTPGKGLTNHGSYTSPQKGARTLKERYAAQDKAKVCRHRRIEARACQVGRQASCIELVKIYSGRHIKC